YPHLIPYIFNCSGFGPPRGITLASSWTWIDHQVSGLCRATGRPFRTRFRYGYASIGLTSPHTITRRPIMQKVRGPTCRSIVVPRLVNMRFQGLFTPLAGVLFAFPSWYLFTI